MRIIFNVFLSAQNGPQKAFVVIIILYVDARLFVLDGLGQLDKRRRFEWIVSHDIELERDQI